MAEKRKYTKKHCKYTELKIDYIDYKDVKFKDEKENSKIVEY